MTGFVAETLDERRSGLRARSRLSVSLESVISLPIMSRHALSYMQT
jgi:hypothetical protein